MKNQKHILLKIRVVYSGKYILREKNSETMLAGKRLPLERRDVDIFVENWKNYLSVMESAGQDVFLGKDGKPNPELAKAQIIHFIKSMLISISE
jgi:hypothetical protein